MNIGNTKLDINILKHKQQLCQTKKSANAKYQQMHKVSIHTKRHRVRHNIIQQYQSGFKQLPQLFNRNHNSTQLLVSRILEFTAYSNKSTYTGFQHYHNFGINSRIQVFHYNYHYQESQMITQAFQQTLDIQDLYSPIHIKV